MIICKMGGAVDNRLLELEHFNTTLPLTNSFKIKKICSNLFFAYQAHKSPKIVRILNETPQMLESKSFIKTTAKLDKNTYLTGYFQHLHCFSHITHLLRDEFRLKRPLTHKAQTLRNRILSTQNATFLHIRRGDFMNIPFLIKLGSGYYSGAIKALKRRLKNPHIFVFSDDIEFAKTHFLNSIDTNGIELDFIDSGSTIEDFCLMQSCKNAIIANSTFSWWAAYLIDNSDKIVAIPSRFFYDDTIPKVSYIKPEGYIEIDYNWGFEVK